MHKVGNKSIVPPTILFTKPKTVDRDEFFCIESGSIPSANAAPPIIVFLKMFIFFSIIDKMSIY